MLRWLRNLQRASRPPGLVVFLPNWVGDVVMATPALRALRRHFAGMPIVGVMRPYVENVLEGTGLLDESWLYDNGSGIPEQKEKRVAQRIRSRNFQWALLFTHSIRTAKMAHFGEVPRVAGYLRPERGRYLTLPLETVHENGMRKPYPVRDAYFDLVRAAGATVDPENDKMVISVAPEAEAHARDLFRRLGLSPTNTVCFNSSGAYGPGKIWPDEYFAQLARMLHRRHGCGILVLCGPSPEEMQRAERIVSSAGPDICRTVPPGELSITSSKALIRSCRLMVTTDSGPRLFAAALGVPLVTLFGATDPAWTVIDCAHETQLRIPVDCGPCQQRVCPLVHHKCMRDLTPQMVMDVVEQKLAGLGGRG